MKFEVPSYTADLFGPKYATVIYGRMMTGWSITAILTPQMLAALRTRSADDAVRRRYLDRFIRRSERIASNHRI